MIWKRHAETELDMVDVLLGQATPESDHRIRLAMESNEGLAAVYRQWERIIPALRTEAVRGKKMVQNLVRRFPEQIRALEGEGWAPPRPRWALCEVMFKPVSLQKSLMIVAAAICVVLLSPLVIPFPHTLNRESESRSWRTNDVALRSSHGFSTTYVAFLTHDGHGQGTDSKPFTTLAKGIQAISPGGTIRIKGDLGTNATPDAPRITKPMRIEAVGGSVRIGTS